MKTTLIANELKSVQPLPLPPSGSLYYIDYVYTKPYSITYPDGMVVIHLKKKKIDNKIILQEDSLTRYVADMEYMKKQMMESCGIPKKYLAHKSKQYMGAGYVYAPYIPLNKNLS